VVTSLLTLQKTQVTLLQLREGQIYPVSNLAEVDKEEAKGIDKSFLMSFVNSYYHFDIDNFDKNMEIAKGFFSGSGWKSVSREVQRLREDMTKNFLSQGAVVIEAKKLKQETFKLKIKFYSAVGGETKVSFKVVTLTVRSRELRELSVERPYAYEVENVAEESI
jgi:hypothetical protein